MQHVVIIGNGIAGITAARHIRKLSDKRITVISKESDHFFSRTALMYIYMGHMKYEHTKPYEDNFWAKNRIDLKRDTVNRIDTKNQEISLQSGENLTYNKLILATGSSPNKFGWPGQDAQGVQGLYSIQDLELLEANTQNAQHAVIVGGGLIGIELAEMLRTRNIGVSLLVREKYFWGGVLPKGEAKLVGNHICEHHVDLRLETELEKINTDDQNRVTSVTTKQGETINCQVVGLTVGVHPNIKFLEGSGIKTERGILVNRALETNVANVYAIGDCAQQHQAIGERKPVEQVWYTGRMMGETVAQTICGNPLEYDPGPWFNSAKFFDIEYQTYGWVWAKTKENEASLYWQHTDGKKCLHLVYNKNTQQFLGLNVFGIRIRHEVCHAWLKADTSIEKVINELPAANFDPEFYKKYEPEIMQQFAKNLKAATL
jgi:NAD(P)H-nitrite reductase large subunit